MGAVLSACFPAVELGEVDWKSWKGHPACQKYVVGRQLGSGAFSEVHVAKRKPILFDGEEVALKVIFLGNPKLSVDSKQILKQESEILEKLSHKHIVDVRKTYTWKRKEILIIEEELLHGGEILDAAQEAIMEYDFTMTESFAARVLKQLLQGVAYMHRKGVLHRDLKTENIRLTRPTKEWVQNIEKMHIKIIDFGLSCRLVDKPETGWLGSPGYVAPEVIENQPHSPKMDVYACGVILFMLLTGMKPVDNDICMALSYSKFEANEYPNMIGNKRWEAVSSSGQDLVLKMMERDPKKRISAAQALKHSFFMRIRSLRSASARFGGSLTDMGGSVGDMSERSAVLGGSPGSRSFRPSDIKETDLLNADDAVQETADVERWRDLAATLQKVRQAMLSNPRLARAASKTPAQQMWLRALARAYLRTRKGGHTDVGAGRVGTAAVPLPTREALQKSLSSASGKRPRHAVTPSPGSLRESASPPSPLSAQASLEASDVAAHSALQVRLQPTAAAASPMPNTPRNEIERSPHKRMKMKDDFLGVVAASLEQEEEGRGLYALEDKLLKAVAPEFSLERLSRTSSAPAGTSNGAA